jgi:glycosyltransferase involved in cell wall biosynthesis
VKENDVKRLSVVIPVYYNAGTLETLYERLSAMHERIADRAQLEIVLVDDGSGDRSRDILERLAARDPARVRSVFLSRNFGSFNAILAGLGHATGDCFAIISADLQDPPEMIPAMYERWEAGDRTVMAVREKREDPLSARLFSKLSYAILRRLALRDFPKGGFDFVLIDRQVRDIIVGMGERNTFLMGLIVWVGFTQSQIHYTRRSREAGESRWTFWNKFKYLIDSILAFSYAPMRLMSAIGFVLAFLGLCYALFLIVQRLTFHVAVPGWTALMVVVLVLFGFQFVAMGVTGEYIWRTLDEVRKRPAFIVERVIGGDGESRRGERDR